MRKIILFTTLFFLLFSKCSFAKHLKGGWIQYEYISTDTANKTNKYKITVRQYLDCDSHDGQIDLVVHLGIFDGGTNSVYRNLTVALTSTTQPDKTSF